MSKRLEDMKKLTELTNEFVERFIDLIDPRDYNNDREFFVQQAITFPAMIAASIIDKTSGTFSLKRKDVLRQYFEKVKLALRWVDHKKDENERDMVH